MSKFFLIICMFSSGFFINDFAQQQNFKVFQGDGFEISYPQKWIAGKDGNIYNFYLRADLGDISVSAYKNSNLSPDFIKKTILELNEKRQANDTVMVINKGKVKEYTYEYLDSNIKWIVKGIQSKKNFFLMTLNWKLTEWNDYSLILLQSFNSLKLK